MPGEIVPVTTVPDLSRLRLSEVHKPFLAKGAKFHSRPKFLGFLADRALDVLQYGGEAGIQWTQGTVHVFGRKAENRLTAFYGDAGATYRYSGRTLHAIPWSRDETCVLSSIRRMVEKATGDTYNCCLLNLYRNGNDSIGFHSDNEESLAPGSSIASVSLGATRKFVVEPKTRSAAVPLFRKEFPAVHGGLIVMGGTAQKRFVHGVPADRRVQSLRISLTFRKVRT